MRGVRGDAATPGEFRRSQNWIGRPGCTLADAAFVPPPPDRLMECLGAWETFLHDDTLPPLVQAALAHVAVRGHPSRSSTATGAWVGCSSRCCLIARGVLPSPLLYLSAWFEATRDEYYARLSGVTERGEWEEWLGYFLTGAAGQAEDALGRIQRIDALLARWREELAKASSRLPERAIELFAENPYWTVNRLAARLGVAFTTAQRAIDRLEAAGIVALAGRGEAQPRLLRARHPRDAGGAARGSTAVGPRRRGRRP